MDDGWIDSTTYAWIVIVVFILIFSAVGIQLFGSFVECFYIKKIDRSVKQYVWTGRLVTFHHMDFENLFMEMKRSQCKSTP